MPFTTYWENNGAYQPVYDALWLTIPSEGECPAERPALEALRVAGNAYYDLYNNGGCNQGATIRRVFGIRLRDFDESSIYFKPAVDQVERKLDTIILAAAREANEVAR